LSQNAACGAQEVDPQELEWVLMMHYGHRRWFDDHATDLQNPSILPHDT
jgi:hypothetical protein